MIKEEYLKVLNFRDELIDLLNKYKFSLSADNKDNGDIVIDTGNEYIMSDDYHNYSINKWDNEMYAEINLMEEYIKHRFKEKNEREFSLGNHGNHHCGIITNDKYKAEMIINKVVENNKSEVIKFSNGVNDKYILLKDKREYIWIKPIDSSRGYRFKNAYIDKEISKYVFDTVVYPMLCLYTGEEGIKVF